MLSAGRPSTQESINPEHSHALSVASGRLSEEGQSAGPGAKDSGNMKGLQKIYSQLLNRAAEAAVDVDGEQAMEARFCAHPAPAVMLPDWQGGS